MKAALEDNAEALEVSQDRKNEVRQAIIDIRRGSAKSKFAEGELLGEVLDGSYWESYGFSSFDEFCAKELGYAKRTGYKRVSVWRKLCNELQYDPASLLDYQWSKLELVHALCKPSNVAGWLKDCEKLTYDQLEYKVKEHSRPPGSSEQPTTRGTRNQTTRVQPSGAEDQEGNEPKVTFRCVMFQSQYDNLKAALEIAQGQLENQQANYALDMIAADFQATTMTGEDEGASEKRLQVICEDLGRAFNAKITVTMNEGSVADQFAKDRESSKERKKKLKAAQKAQAGDTKDPETGDDIDPETGEPKPKKGKGRGKKGAK